jgi:polyhydroxybutyrate depolymerase
MGSIAGRVSMGWSCAILIALLTVPACRRHEISETARAPASVGFPDPPATDSARQAELRPSAEPLQAAAVFEPPGIAAGERLPVVFFLHGLGGSGQQSFDRLELESFGRRRRVFVVAPDGTPDRKGRRFWNAVACCDLDRAGIDDVARLTSLIDGWRRRPEVDARRVYLIGYSNGGFMAHRLACAIGDRLAAIASIAGAGVEPGQACPIASPIGVLEIHGDRDPTIRYEGGHLFDSPRLPTYVSARATVSGWAARLGCRGDGGATAAPPQDPSAKIQIERHDGCPLGSAELWTIPGSGHDIATPARIDELWPFLSRFTKPANPR